MLRDGESILPRFDVFGIPFRAFVNDMFEVILQPLRLYRTSRTRAVESVPLALPGREERKMGSTFMERGLMGDDIQSNLGLMFILRRFAAALPPGEVSVLLVDVGVFDRIVKVV